MYDYTCGYQVKTISTAIQTLIFSSISLQNEVDTALFSVNTFITVKSLCSSSVSDKLEFLLLHTLLRAIVLHYIYKIPSSSWHVQM